MMVSIKEYYDLYEDAYRRVAYEQVLKKLSNTITSREFFRKNLKGEVYPKRKKLHTDIINDYLDKYNSGNEPIFHFILGSIGSGKTSLKDKFFKTTSKNDFLYINFDEIKLKLPEYELLKRINPKKASYFVQSESAKIAGILKKKAMKKRVNIVYEKNIRESKDGTLRLFGEMKEAFKRGYEVTLHVVFLDSVKEAWKRVQERYKRTRRYVSKKDVIITFQDLFPNLNRLVNEVNGNYHMVLHYNSDSGIKNKCIGGVWIVDGILESVKKIEKRDNLLLYTIDRYYVVLFKDRVRSLSPSTKNRLKQLSFLQNILK